MYKIPLNEVEHEELWWNVFAENLFQHQGRYNQRGDVFEQEMKKTIPVDVVSGALLQEMRASPLLYCVCAEYHLVQYLIK